MIKRFLSSLFILAAMVMAAQETVNAEGPKMADTFRSEGKIYVVISVISIIFIAIVLFLVYIERKLKKIEEKIK